MRTYGPNDVRLSLSFLFGTTRDIPQQVMIEGEHAPTGDPMFRVTLTPAQFVDLMGARNNVVARSDIAIAPQQPPGPRCTRCDAETFWSPMKQHWQHVPDAAKQAGWTDHLVTFASATAGDGSWIEVTLTATANRFVSLPAVGQLQITEYGPDGAIAAALFRRRQQGRGYTGAVEVAQPRFTYSGTRHPAAPAARP